MRNETGGTLAKGTLVYISGYSATYRRVLVAKADADDPAKQATHVLDHAVSNNSNSFMVVEALIGGLNTSSFATVGDPAYVSATAGEFTATAPVGPAQFVQKVGQVKVKSATVGVIHFQTLFTLERVGSNFLNESAVRYAETSLTNAQMLALRGTPIEVVAAPGAGKVIEFLSAVLLFDRTGAYTESDDNLAFKYVDGSGQQASQTIEATGFVDAAADAIINAIAKPDTLLTVAQSVNKALVLHNVGNGEFGGGNAANVVRVKVAYRVHTTGF
jgi:hypothetical protein